MKKENHEIKYKNGCKLEFKGLDDSNVRGLRSIIDYSENPIYEGNEFFSEKFIEENYPNYTQLKEQYLDYCKQSDVDKISLFEWCLRTGKCVISDIDMKTRYVTFTFSNMPLSIPINYQGDISEYEEDDK